MHATKESIILSRTGAMGAELLRHVFNRHDGFVKPFVDKNPKLAADWVAVHPQRRSQTLTASHITDLFGQNSLKEIQDDLCMSEEAVVRLTDTFLYQAVQMSSPSGMHIHLWSAKCLDRDLARSFAPHRIIT